MNRAVRYLAPSETLQLETRPHPMVLNGALAIAACLCACAYGIAYIGHRLGRPYLGYSYVFATVFFIAAAGVFSQAALRRAAQVVIVTDRRIVEIRGLWSHNLRELRLDAVQGVNVDQSIYGRLFNFGTVTLEGGNDRPMVLKNISFPLELLQALQDDRTRRLERATVRA